MSMESCGPPEWLMECAWEVFRLVRESNARARFRQMIRRGAEECVRLHGEVSRKFAPKGPPEKEDRPDLYGPPPFHLGPKLSLASRYVISALIHDHCIDKVRERAGQHVPALNPWPELGEIPDGQVKSAATYNTLLHHNMEVVADRHEDMIREAVEAVRVDLQGKGRKRRRRQKYKTDYDPKDDKKLFNDWKAAKASGTQRIAQFAKARGKAEDEVRAALERHRKRS